MAQNSSFGRLACLFLDRQREKGTRTKNTDFQPDCLFLDQQGEKGTFELKTRVLDPKVTPFERFWALFGVPRDCLFPLPVEEKAISGLPRNAHDGLFPLPVEEKQLQGSRGRPKTAPFRTILDTSLSPLRLPFPLACRGKGCFRAPWECSRWPFPSACRGKGHFRLTREAQEQPFSDDSGCRL